MNRGGDRLVVTATVLLIISNMIVILLICRMDWMKEIWVQLEGEQRLVVGIVFFMLPLIYLCLLGRIALRSMVKEINRGNYYQVRFIVLAECTANAMENAQFNRVGRLLRRLEEEKQEYKNYYT